MRKIPIVALLLIVSIFGVAATETMQDGKKLLPSQAQDEIRQTLRVKNQKGELKTYELYSAAQKELSLQYLKKVSTNGLTPQEHLAYGDLLASAEKSAEAQAVYEELASGKSVAARDAYKKILGMLSGKVEEHAEELEAKLKKFRQKFGQSPDDTFGIYSYVASLTRHYADKGNHEKAIQLAMEELNSLTTDAPYYAYSLPSGRYESFLALGRKQEIVELTEKHIGQFEAIVEKREKNKPADEEEAKKYDGLTRRYKGVVSGLQANLTKINLINGTAPGFNFTHFFNTDPIDFAKTKGKVVLIDFWANWCGPCISTFPEMREFYAEYAPKGVVVIGVTGFQGSMANHGKDRVQNLSQDDELKLTQEFIKHQNVTWPIAFSDRNCYDSEYGVRGIPTAVIIDKKGNVRMFTHPYYQEELRAMIDSLLAEE